MIHPDEFDRLVAEGCRFGCADSPIGGLGLDDDDDELFGYDDDDDDDDEFSGWGWFRFLLKLPRRIEDTVESYHKWEEKGSEFGEKRMRAMAHKLQGYVLKQMKKEPGWEPTEEAMEILEENDLEAPVEAALAVQAAPALVATAPAAPQVIVVPQVAAVPVAAPVAPAVSPAPAVAPPSSSGRRAKPGKRRRESTVDDDLAALEAEMEDDEDYGRTALGRTFMKTDKRLKDIMRTYDKVRRKSPSARRLGSLANALVRNVRRKQHEKPGWYPTNKMASILKAHSLQGQVKIRAAPAGGIAVSTGRGAYGAILEDAVLEGIEEAFSGSLQGSVMSRLDGAPTGGSGGPGGLSRSNPCARYLYYMLSNHPHDIGGPDDWGIYLSPDPEFTRACEMVFIRQMDTDAKHRGERYQAVRRRTNDGFLAWREVVESRMRRGSGLAGLTRAISDTAIV